GHVCSGRQFDPHRVSRTLACVVEAKALAHLTGFHADGGVVTRIVADGPAEDLNTDRALLQRVRGAAEGVIHDVREKRLAALAGAEFMAGEDPLELFANRIP